MKKWGRQGSVERVSAERRKTEYVLQTYIGGEEVLSTWSMTISAVTSGKENQLKQLWI